MYVISVELGTSSVREAIVSDTLELLFQESVPVSLLTDSTRKAEVNAEEILFSSRLCIQAALDWAQEAKIRVAGLTFSNAVASLVCLDEQFTPILPVLTYTDLRAHREADLLLGTHGKAFFLSTATPVHASYWLPKLLWLKNTKPDFEKCHYFCTLKDLLVYQLTGQFVTDFSNAVATGLCNVLSGDWDARLLEIAGISTDQLPKIHPTTTLLQTNRGHSPGLIDLPDDITVVLGAIDGVLSSLGAGAYKPGQVTTMLGSSGACRMAAESPLTNPESYGVWSYPLDDQIWIRGGAMNNGGLVTRWLVDNFSPAELEGEQAFTAMFAGAEQVGVGADNLLFLPYLFGERAPIYNENARGVFFGLSSLHTRAHFARAGIEGILFALYSIFDQLQIKRTDEVEIRATGGYVRSDLMLHIQADIFGHPILVPGNFEGSLIGAAALAFKAMQHISDYDQLFTRSVIEKKILPNREHHQQYQALFIKFQQLYKTLEPLFTVTTEPGE
jgi:gluconokinase